MTLTEPSTAPPLDPRSLNIDAALPDAPFVERHHRTIDRPIASVWPACRAVTVGEIRTLRPLMTLRELPGRLRRRRGDHAGALTADTPLLHAFADEGFVLLRADDHPHDGRASILFGAAGRFWSPTDSSPVPFPSPEAFLSFAEPGHARTVARLDAVDLGDGRTLVETETRVAGTDPAATRRFAPYWAVIRLPSGLIRRSWLAAIERRAGRA